MALNKTAKLALNKCMGLKKGETCLIITDQNKLDIANELFDAAKSITSEKVEIIEIPVGKVNGEEPPEHVKEIMKSFDVILMPTTKSLSHTSARKEACEAGARIASMPNINEEILLRAVNVDYDKMSELGEKIKLILEKADKVRVITEKGTDIEFSVKERAVCNDNGIYNEKGRWGNLPAGEVCLAPVEETANGVFIADASFGGIGTVDKDIIIEVKQGYASSIKGGESAEHLKEMLKKAGKKAYNIAELGIGTNEKAQITGIALEDEKVLGTAHIALGNNLSYGGSVDVPLHLDGIFNKPTILVDNKQIMEKGKLLV